MKRIRRTVSAMAWAQSAPRSKLHPWRRSLAAAEPLGGRRPTQAEGLPLVPSSARQRATWAVFRTTYNATTSLMANPGRAPLAAAVYGSADRPMSCRPRPAGSPRSLFDAGRRGRQPACRRHAVRQVQRRPAPFVPQAKSETCSDPAGSVASAWFAASSTVAREIEAPVHRRPQSSAA